MQENYGSVLKDCSKALTLNERSSKGYYRSAVALLALERLDEALDCCDRCLAFNDDNKSVREVRERAARQKAEKERKERENLDRFRRAMEEKRRLQQAFQVSDISCGMVIVPDISTGAQFDSNTEYRRNNR